MYPEQKEFENLHVTAIKSGNRISTLEEKPRWHNGTNDPSKAIGINGDFYLNETTSDVFLKKNGIWQ